MKDEIAEVFHKRFLTLRGELSQIAFAEKLDVSRASIAAWETEKRLPTIKQLYAIAVNCGVSIDWLLGLSDRKELDV